MNQRVAVVIPALDNRDLLAKNLPLVIKELEARACDDELTVVDDTGQDLLAAWVAERFPGKVRVIVRGDCGGFAKALVTGARLGTAELLLCLNPDVRVRPGFLSPLVEAMADPNVHSVSPRVLLNGDPNNAETHQRMLVDGGRLISQPLTPDPDCSEPLPIPFPLGGAMMVRREEFLAEGGFDPLLAPFYFEDTDLGLTAWRRGRKVLEIPASVVEHHHRGTIGRVVPDNIVRAAIERNRLLVHWKHLDSKTAAHEHYLSLYRDALDAGIGERREELIWMALALEELEAATDSRKNLGSMQLSLDAALAAADPSR